MTSARPRILLWICLGLSLGALSSLSRAEPLIKQGRPHLENYASYGEFLDALNAWQRKKNQASKTSAAPAGAVSEAKPSSKPASKTTDSSSSVAKTGPHEPENIEAAVKTAAKLNIDDSTDVSPDSDPDLTPAPAPALANTAISGGLSAPAAGSNAAISDNKLRSNVDLLTNLSDISNADHGQSPVQAQQPPSTYVFTIPDASSSSAAAVNVQIRTPPTATVNYIK